MTACIQDGALVKWTPSSDLFQIFPRNTAFRLFQMVPLIGTVDHICGNAGLLSFRGPKGKEAIPVLLSECTLPGVSHGTE